MSLVAFRVDPKTKKKLQLLAKMNGINLSALIKLYLTKGMNRDLNEMTQNGMTVAEELELLAMQEEGGDGTVYNNVEEYIKSLEE